jgi:hypothetical protein
MKKLLWLFIITFLTISYTQTVLGLHWNYEKPGGGYTKTVEIYKVDGKESYFFCKIYLGSIITPVVEVYTLVNNMVLETATAGGLFGGSELQYINPAEIVLKLPIKVGDKWSSEKKGWSIEREVVKKYEKLQVEEKIYNDVIEVKEKKGNLEQRYFYGKGIGLVQITVKNSETGVFQPFLILTEFDSK